MARTWTCRGCKTTAIPKIKRKCPECGKTRPATRKPAHLKVLAEISHEEWYERFGDSCNICGKKPTEGQRRLNRDHQHTGPRAGEPRGSLCGRCNRALPAWIDAAWLAKAHAYLDAFERRAA